MKATRSNKGVVKTTLDPGALFIGSIKVSVNTGPNKAELWPPPAHFRLQRKCAIPITWITPQHDGGLCISARGNPRGRVCSHVPTDRLNWVMNTISPVVLLKIKKWEGKNEMRKYGFVTLNGFTAPHNRDDSVVYRSTKLGSASPKPVYLGQRFPVWGLEDQSTVW